MGKSERAEAIYQTQVDQVHRRTDELFVLLMIIEYFAGIAAALVVSPRAWSGGVSSVHLHVWAAVVLGALILSAPIALAVLQPGKSLTRHVVGVGQMLFSALLIHLTGGRIETHFHVFGSLAFLGFYRDWRVLITASCVVALDHFLRGVYWPQSVYGIASSDSLRWLEHTGWVAFEDLFLAIGCQQSLDGMRESAERRAELEETRAELGKALESKDAFMSICSHELKTPLTSLSLQAQMINRGIRKGKSSLLSPERMQKLLNLTEMQTSRLLRLIEDMLDHSRLRMGKLELNVDQVELGELTLDVIERQSLQAEAAGCELTLRYAGHILGRWDRFRIEQVISNLLSNAFKYGSGAPVVVELHAKGKEALVTVEDHGRGIPKGEQEKIFRQFERLSGSRAIDGLGLGLYISKSIVELHGGRIWLESEAGKGSKFTFALPVP